MSDIFYHQGGADESSTEMPSHQSEWLSAREQQQMPVRMQE
jgi:hypothetical protein